MDFPEIVERLHEFVSRDVLADSLRVARREFVTLRGDLFDSDSDYEARLGVFLDWFLCDRTVRINGAAIAPAQHFIDLHHAEFDAESLAWIEAFRDSSLRLLVCKKLKKNGHATFEDIVLGGKLEIQYAAESFIGLERKQVVEARVVDNCGDYRVSPYWMPRPSDGLKIIQKSAKLFRSSHGSLDPDSKELRLDLSRFIHRVAGLSNRANRYPHVKVIEIFKELQDSPLA